MTSAAADADGLLHLARRIMSGDVAVPLGREARCAAALTRSALELIVPRLCAQNGLDVAKSGTHVQLACLRAVTAVEGVADAGIGGHAAVLWAQLSGACHQHAYELAPRTAEVADLLARCEELARHATDSEEDVHASQATVRARGHGIFTEPDCQ